MSGMLGLHGRTSLAAGRSRVTPDDLVLTDTSVATTGTVTASPGAWTQAWAAGVWSEDRLILAVGAETALSNVGTLVAVGVGAAGAETPIVDWVGAGITSGRVTLPTPVLVPAGARLAVHAQQASGNPVTAALRIVHVPARLIPGLHPRVLSRTGNSDPDAVHVALTNGSPGAWAEVWATGAWSGPRILVGVDLGASATNNLPTFEFGSGGSVIARNQWFAQRSDIHSLDPLTVPIRIPAGAQLQARINAAQTQNLYAVWSIDASTPGLMEV